MHHTFRHSLALALACAAPTASAALTFPSSFLAPTDSVNWSQLGPDGTTINQSFNATTGLGKSVTGLLAGTDGITAVAGGSWLSQPSGFVDGDTLIWAEDGQGDGSGPITVTLPASAGAGAYIQSAYPAEFTALLDVYGAGNTLLGSHAATSNANGDPLFLGAISNGALITKLVFSVTGFTVPPFGSDPTDFALDSLLLIPETSTWVAGVGLLSALVFRFRQQKHP